MTRQIGLLHRSGRVARSTGETSIRAKAVPHLAKQNNSPRLRTTPPGKETRSRSLSEPRVSGELVHRLLNPLGFAVGQLAVFQGGPSRTGGKAPLSAS